MGVGEPAFCSVPSGPPTTQAAVHRSRAAGHRSWPWLRASSRGRTRADVGEPAGPWALRRLQTGLPATPLTVLSAEAVARRKSSKGEKSKSVTRSVGEKQLTWPDEDECPVLTHYTLSQGQNHSPGPPWLTLCPHDGSLEILKGRAPSETVGQHHRSPPARHRLRLGPWWPRAQHQETGRMGRKLPRSLGTCIRPKSRAQFG